jgi:hypothetical protein
VLQGRRGVHAPSPAKKRNDTNHTGPYRKRTGIGPGDDNVPLPVRREKGVEKATAHDRVSERKRLGVYSPLT